MTQGSDRPPRLALWGQSLGAGLLAAGLFAAISALALWLYPQAADKALFLTPLTPAKLAVYGSYWDTGHYAALATKPQCEAFYPLWPGLIRLLFAPTDAVAATMDLFHSTWVLALVGLPPVYVALRRLSGDTMAALAVLVLYSVNPYAIFRVLGYTEALFAIEAALMVLLLQRWQDGRRGVWTMTAIAAMTALISVTRPMLPQIFAAALLALLAVTLARRTLRPEAENPGLLRDILARKDLMWLVGLILAASVAGYASYGLYCLHETGDFLYPFADQRRWGKKVGLYLWNLIWPFAGHNEFMGLYFPVLLLLVAIWRLGLSRPGRARASWRILPVWASLPLATEPSIWLGVHAAYLGAQVWRPALRGPARPAEAAPAWAESFSFWFCLFIAGAHGALILLTDRHLQSLARFIFGQPYFFFALASLAPMVPQRWRGFAFGFGFIASALLLIGIWGLYARNDWIG